MADKIKIHTGRLGSDADRMQSSIRRVEKKIDEMQSSVASLQQMWEGPGSQAFHRVFLEDLRAMGAVVDDLKSAYAYDINAKVEYESCEKKISSLIADLKI